MRVWIDLKIAFHSGQNFYLGVLLFWSRLSWVFKCWKSKEIKITHTSTIPLSCLIWLHCKRSWLADWSWMWRNSLKGFNTVTLGGSGQRSHLNVTSTEFAVLVQFCGRSFFVFFLNFFVCFFRRDRSGDFHHRGCAGHNCPDHLQQERDVQEPGSQSSAARRRSRVSLPQPGGLSEHAHWQPEGVLHLAGAQKPPNDTPDRTDRHSFAGLALHGANQSWGVHWRWLP